VSPVNLVDHDHVDQMGLDIGQQPFKGGPFRRSSGIAGVIIESGKGNPALVPLTLYICVTGLALGMQGVEILFEPLLGGFSGVDRAAKNLCGGCSWLTHVDFSG
jgi:hypothetical protein